MKKILATGVALVGFLSMATPSFAFEKGYDFNNGIFDEDPSIISEDYLTITDNVINKMANSMFMSANSTKQIILNKPISPKAMSIIADDSNNRFILKFYRSNDSTGDYDLLKTLDLADIKLDSRNESDVPYYSIPNPVEFDRIDIVNDNNLNSVRVEELEFFNDLSDVNEFDKGIFDTVTHTTDNEQSLSTLTDNYLVTTSTVTDTVVTFDNYIKGSSMYFSPIDVPAKSIDVTLKDTETGEVLHTQTLARSGAYYDPYTVEIPSDVPEFNQVLIEPSSYASSKVAEFEIFGDVVETEPSEPSEPSEPEEPGQGEDEDNESNSNGNTSSEEDVDFNLISGGLELTTSPIITFGDILLQSEPKTYKTSFDAPFNVKDLRGTQEGWRLDVSSTQFSVVEPEGGFADGTSAHQLPKGSLAISPLESVTQVGDGAGVAPTSAMSQNKIVDDGVITVAKAEKGTGAGEFNLEFQEDALSLTIDASTAKIDNVNYPDGKTPYEATLTWNLVSAP